MTGSRPPVALTAQVLTVGTTGSAVALAAAFVAGLLGAAAASTLLATAGILALLATPVVGLIATFFEVRRVQPRTAQLALIVLAVLALSATVALLTH